MNKKINLIFVYLIISFVFLIPLSISNINAADSVPGNTNKEISNMCSDGANVNPGDSIIMSALTLCLPGILEKIIDYKNIKCDAVVCSYESILREQDPSFCKAKEGYDICVFIVGEAFAIPPMTLMEYFKDMVADVLKDPMGIAFGVAVNYYRKWITKLSKGQNSIAIAVGAMPLVVIDIMAATETLSQIAENGFGGGDDDDSCDQVKDIKKELKEIKSKLSNVGTS